ncbi:MAG: VanZ family protein [Oscillospiraceae bacterium]|nr:VanZ family protein [Oscillospiraceae bacterium]
MYELMRTLPGRTLRYLRLARRYAVMMVPGMLVMLGVYGCLYAPRMRRLERRDLISDRRRELVLALFLMYCGGMASLTLLPLEYAKVLKILREGFPNVPFFHIGNVSVTPMAKMFNDGFTFLANIFMFMPFGFCPALLWRRSRWYKALGIGVLISENIECWQLFIGRTFDVDDLILNVTGVMLGWLLWVALKRPRLTCRPRPPVEEIISAVVSGEKVEEAPRRG